MAASPAARCAKPMASRAASYTTGWGTTFEVIFKSGKSAMLDMTNRNFKEFFLCPSCETPFKVRKREAARFFLVEMVECRECGMAHSFPFGWLLSKLDVDFRKET
ncbi:hypothetical protein [Primorskyibacter marinus]|uniref:hypothetical protein n=1 Tax=Primorskyibacter marinus TaxID=1977320 RepID=UPI001300A509|nr:hypothetical protein [Primorskyibacter marinus]